MLRVKPLSLGLFVRLVKDYPGFAFARFSDGGFFCMQGVDGQNCDGVVYTEEQAGCLLAALQDRKIVHGLTSIALHAANAEMWLAEKGIDVEWYDADVMNKAADNGELYPFVEELCGRKTVVCGASHLARLRAFPIAAFVECHPTQAFEEVDRLEQEVAYQVEKKKADTVLLSAGQGASPTLVSRLHHLFPKIVVVDVGSVWDPYVGVYSRSGHKRAGKAKIEQLGWHNFRQNIRAW